LSKSADLPLVFETEEKPISAGYHVTEVKHCKVDSLDCGQGVNQWEEIVIQLIDGAARGSDDHMRSSKFLGIVEKATATLEIGEGWPLYFEFAHNDRAMKKLEVLRVVSSQERTTVLLSAKTAACKPFERAKRAGGVSNTGPCCGGTTSTRDNISDSQDCCSGASVSDSAQNACCS